jgi:hypothetical protein
MVKESIMASKAQQYTYRQYRDISAITGVSVPAEWQRTRSVYRALAKRIISTLEPTWSDEQIKAGAERIAYAEWFEDLLRAAYEAHLKEKR